MLYFLLQLHWWSKFNTGMLFTWIEHVCIFTFGTYFEIISLTCSTVLEAQFSIRKVWTAYWMKMLLVYVRFKKKHFVHYIKRTFSSAGETPRTTTTTATSTTSAGPFSCLSAGSFPYPGNCSLYYICTAVGADPITVVSNLHSCSLVPLHRTSFHNTWTSRFSNLKKDFSG